MRYLLTISLLLPLCVQAQSKKWADSMEKIVYRFADDSTTDGLDYEEYVRVKYTLLRKYMAASIALGRYYDGLYNTGKLPDLKMALRYYLPITLLRSGTDSDIGYEERLIAMREKVGQKVAGYYNTGKIKGVDTLRNYVVARYLKSPQINVPQQMNWVISDDTSTINIRYFRGSFMLCDDAKAILQNVAALMRMYPYKKMVIFGYGNDSYYSQQLSWEQSEAVIVYITKCGISRDRFIHQWGMPGERHLVQMRFAMPFEDGPSRTAPPNPGFKY